MAIDRGYGSGKPRSAANSRARQRVAKGQMTKGGKKVQLNKTLKKIAAKNPVTGFIGGGVSGFKIISGAMSRVASRAAAVEKFDAADEALSLAFGSKLAAKFPNSPGAKKIVNELKQTMIRHQSQGGGSGVPRGVLSKTEYQIPREESIVIARGAAKVIGKSAGGDQGVIALGKEFGKIAKQPKTPYFNKETNRFVNPEAGPYQVRASSTGKLDLKDNVVRGYPVGGPNAERISRLNRQSQEEIIRRNIQRDIANKQKGMKRGR